MPVLKSIVLIYLNCLLAIQGNAQVTVQEGTQFLFIKYTNQPPPQDRFARIDTLSILSKNNDTLIFEMIHLKSGKSNFQWISIADKTFGILGLDTFLMYDYTKIAGDTFRYTLKGKTDLFVIDSVDNRILDDQKNHKHWYLSNKDNLKIVWVENLGEQFYGWNYTDYLTPDKGTSLKAICHNANLISWNASFNGFEPDTMAPSCDLINLAQLVSINKAENKNNQVTLYPNPARGISYIKSDKIYANYALFNMNGIEVEKGLVQNNQINFSKLPNGIYLIQLGNEQNQFTQRVSVLK